MADSIIKEAQERMIKAIDGTKHKFTGIRAGRASISMLDGLKVEQYGMIQALNQVANVSAPEARILTIDPWDKSVIKDIERAIMLSDLGLTPNNDGKIIRLVIPELTADRRKDYVKLAKKEAEEGKVTVRNIRKDINNSLRKAEKDSEITEDDLKRLEKQVQELTDKTIAEIEVLLAKKEKEITTV